MTSAVLAGTAKQVNEGQRGQLWKHLSPEPKLHEQMEQKDIYGPASSEMRPKIQQAVKPAELTRREGRWGR